MKNNLYNKFTNKQFKNNSKDIIVSVRLSYHILDSYSVFTKYI